MKYILFLLVLDLLLLGHQDLEPTHVLLEVLDIPVDSEAQQALERFPVDTFEEFQDLSDQDIDLMDVKDDSGNLQPLRPDYKKTDAHG